MFVCLRIVQCIKCVVTLPKLLTEGVSRVILGRGEQGTDRRGEQTCQQTAERLK